MDALEYINKDRKVLKDLSSDELTALMTSARDYRESVVGISKVEIRNRLSHFMLVLDMVHLTKFDTDIVLRKEIV